MKKIIVIGCPGSGKSTFSWALHQITGIPLFHLDMLYWNPDRTTVDKTIFRERLADVMRGECWIIDGNYSGTMEMRMEACDTIVFLDFPAEVCFEGIRERRGKVRSDIPWVESEEDEEFSAFIRDFNIVNRPKILDSLDKFSDKNVLIFKNRREADAYLDKLRTDQ